MSKAKLIELIKGNQEDVYDFFAETPTYEVQKILLEALKDQDRNTRQGCADAVYSIAYYAEENDTIMSISCSEACLNYQDKDLDGL